MTRIAKKRLRETREQARIYCDALISLSHALPEGEHRPGDARAALIDAAMQVEDAIGFLNDAINGDRQGVSSHDR